MMEDIKNKQSALLSLLKGFDAFAKNNNIRYYVAYGSCLGAVRESGFIPWDGDIDIFMRMPDYRRCEELFHFKGDSSVQWLSYKTNKDAPNLMGRIYGRDISLKNLERFPYIDIFALAGMPNDVKEQTAIMKESLRNFRIYWVKKRSYIHSLNRKKSVIGLLLKVLLFWYPLSYCKKIFEKEMEQYPYDKASIIAPITGFYGQKDVMPKTWFEKEPIYVPFCDMMVPIVSNYDEYLRHMYGDNYMTPIQYKRYK